MEIIINHLTRMRPGYICVAGVDLATGRHVRPVLGGTSLGTALLRRHGGPFALGWRVELGAATAVGHPPEVEDWRFEARRARAVAPLPPGEFWALLERVA